MANIGATAVLKATFDSKDFDQGMHRAQKRTKDFENQTKKAQGQLRLMRGGLGQLGHQVQDVAVQLQAGQNAMLVFGQQGSQIASLMGPNGALIGAVLAVGAAIATALLPTLFGMGEGMKEAENHVDDLIDKFDELSGASRDLALLQAKQKIDGLKESIKLTQKELDAGRKTYTSVKDGITIVTESAEDWEERSLTLTEKIKDLNKQLRDTKTATDDTTTVFEKMRDRLVEQNLKLTLGAHLFEVYKIRTSGAKLEEQNFLIALLETNKALEESNRLTGDNGDEKAKKAAQLKSILSSLKDETDAIKQRQKERNRVKAKEEADAKAQQARFESIRDGYALQAAAVGKTAEQIELLKLRGEELKPEQIAEIQRLKDLAKANQELFEAQAREEADEMGLSGAFTKVKDEFADMDSSMQQAMLSNTSTVLGSVSQTMGAVGQLFKEGSSEAKAFMLVSKGLEASNAIIAGLSGAVAIKAAYAKMALANPLMAGAYEAMGTASAAMMKTMGFVNAGMIMGQAVASFDGGGFTGHGARVAGVDGKGGFPAILHPNETVVDHTKGQSMATNVTINIQAHDTNGFDKLLRSRRGEIISIVNKALNNRGVSSLI